MLLEKQLTQIQQETMLENVNNGHGQNTYTNVNEIITTSNTNYAGEETFDDGTSTISIHLEINIIISTY